MDDKILSTNNTISNIIKGGQVSQSLFSEVFIKDVDKKFNLDIVACYVQTGEHNKFSNGKPTNDFVDEVLVPLYVRESCLKSIQSMDRFNEEIEAIFWNTIQSLKLQWSYSRVYSQEELSYYGFTNTPRQQWNVEKIQKPTALPRKNFVVKVESFDRLALYHLLSDKVASVGKYIRQTYGVNVKIYVGFLNFPSHMATHFIVFNTQKEYEHFLSLVHPNKVLSAIRENLKVYDYWDVLNTCSYCPQYRVWHKLSG